MFGLQLEPAGWAIAGVLTYLLFRVAFAAGQIAARVAADGEPTVTINCPLVICSGVAGAVGAWAGITLALADQNQGLRLPAQIAAVPVGLVSGVVADILFGLYAFRLSQWLAAFRVPRHREHLSHHDPAVRLLAARRLSQLNRYAAPAVPELLVALKDDEPEVRAYAMLALGTSWSEDADIPAAARVALADPDPRTRIAAAATLVRLKAPPAELLPALCEGVIHPDDTFAQNAASAVYELGEAGAPAAGALVAAVLERDPPNSAAISALEKIGAAGVPGLVEILRRGERNDRHYAAQALGEMGAVARPAIPALREAAADKDEGLKVAAEKSLRKLGGTVG